MPFLNGVSVQVGMLRLRSEDCFALLTAALSMTREGIGRLVAPKCGVMGFGKHAWGRLEARQEAETPFQWL
jgi:hypothetical protein